MASKKQIKPVSNDADENRSSSRGIKGFETGKPINPVSENTEGGFESNDRSIDRDSLTSERQTRGRRRGN